MPARQRYLLTDYIPVCRRSAMLSSAHPLVGSKRNCERRRYTVWRYRIQDTPAYVVAKWSKAFFAGDLDFVDDHIGSLRALCNRSFASPTSKCGFRRPRSCRPCRASPARARRSASGGLSPAVTTLSPMSRRPAVTHAPLATRNGCSGLVMISAPAPSASVKVSATSSASARTNRRVTRSKKRRSLRCRTARQHAVADRHDPRSRSAPHSVAISVEGPGYAAAVVDAVHDGPERPVSSHVTRPARRTLLLDLGGGSGLAAEPPLAALLRHSRCQGADHRG